MPPPIVEGKDDVNPALKKFLEQQAADEAAELAKLDKTAAKKKEEPEDDN